MRQLASIDDFEARYGEVSSADTALVSTILEDASALIFEAVEGSTADWVTDEDADVPTQVIRVCATATNREWKQSDGIAREQLGEYAVSYRPDRPANLWLTKNERRIVRRAAGLSEPTSIELESPYSGPRADALSDMDFWPIEEEGS